MKRQVNGVKLNGRRTRASSADTCVETRGREILATIVNDAVAEAMRLGLSDSTNAFAPARRVAGARQ